MTPGVSVVGLALLELNEHELHMLPDREEEYECRTVRMLLLDSVVPEECTALNKCEEFSGGALMRFGTAFMTAICKAS